MDSAKRKFDTVGEIDKAVVAQRVRLYTAGQAAMTKALHWHRLTICILLRCAILRYEMEKVPDQFTMGEIKTIIIKSITPYI